MLIPFVRGEADGHFGNDTSENGSETFVESERGFALYDLNSCLNEAATSALEMFVLGQSLQGSALESDLVKLTPRCDRFESCMRTFIVSRGWQTRASIMPAPPPATRFVAAEAGFLPPGPFVVFADIVVDCFLLFLAPRLQEGKAVA